jgi:hypothetical protein
MARFHQFLTHHEISKQNGNRLLAFIRQWLCHCSGWAPFWNDQASFTVRNIFFGFWRGWPSVPNLVVREDNQITTTVTTG